MAPVVAIDDDGVDYTVRTGSTDTVQVREILESSGMTHVSLGQLTMEKTSDGVRIARQDHNSSVMTIGFGSFRHEVEVTVPPGTRLNVSNVGTFDASGLHAPMTVHSNNGRITLTDVASDAELHTTNGRIEIVRGSFASLNATSDNGRITLTDVVAAHAQIHTDNGRIESTHLEIGGGAIQTGNGRIDLGIAAGSNVMIEAHTSSGKVRAAAPLTATVTGDPDDDDRIHTVPIGNGTGRLTVSSDNGSIDISSGSIHS